MKQRRRAFILSILLGTLLMAGRLPGTETAAVSRTPLQSASGAGELRPDVPAVPGYGDYIEGKSAAPEGASITVDAADFTASDGMEAEVRTLDGVPAAVTGDAGTVTWAFTAAEPGLYDVRISYYTIEGKGGSVERQLLLDGSVPFKEARDLIFSRIWVNEGSEKIFTGSGNEYRRTQVEQYGWQDSFLHSSIGYRDESLRVYLDRGPHTLSLASVAEPVAISGITFMTAGAPEPYETVRARYDAAGYRPAARSIRIEGEDAVRKSDPTLYAVEDRTSPADSPFDEAKILLNTIGGNSWRHRQQWIEWEIEAPEDGLYTLSFRVKQDFVSGAGASRCLWIDGRIPFAEASDIRVSYDLQWQMVTLGEDGQPYEFYLPKGPHTIRLQAVIGGMAGILGEVSGTVQELNTLYRHIKMIVGSFPDPLRDYDLEDNVPGLFATMQVCADRLEEVNRQMEAAGSIKGEQSRFIDQLAVQLRSLVKRPDTVPERLNDLSDNINNVSSWLASAGEVPLLIDYLILAPEGAALPPADAGFFAKMWSSVKGFVYSFIYDYYAIDGISGTEDIRDEVTLWLGIGRDQSMILKNMADSTFTPVSRIGLNIRLVDMGILLQAVSSGSGPDIALFMDQAQPLNYGVRGALYDLSRFPDADEVLGRFAESAVVPFRLGTALYGLPEQQMFPMLFYRTDVFGEMGLTVPQTWDDLYRMIPALQEENMEIGLPSPALTTSGSMATSLNPVYAALLLQNGASVYDGDSRYCTLDTLTAVRCFIRWSEFYTKYNFPVFYSDINRFRTGEMPILISSYTFYNTLMLAAPEIRSLWAMAPVPGTPGADGTIDRSVSGTGTACVIFSNAKKPGDAWELLKWWTSTDSQVRFGREIEALQGASARWPTANLQAMQELGWTSDAARQITEQWTFVEGIPEVPGGYYVGRSVDNAIKSVINSGEDARETILDQVDKINKEIRAKRQEFGLE